MWKLQASPEPPESLKHLEQSSPCWAGGNGLMRSGLSPSCRGTTGLIPDTLPFPWLTPAPNHYQDALLRRLVRLATAGHQLLCFQWIGGDTQRDRTHRGQHNRLREVCSNRETLRTSTQEKERCRITELSLSPTLLEWCKDLPSTTTVNSIILERTTNETLLFSCISHSFLL